MLSEELAREVALFVGEVQGRILGIGRELYELGQAQKFEVVTMDRLFEMAEEELRDQVAYCTMLRIRLRRLREAVTGVERNPLRVSGGEGPGSEGG